MGAIGNLKTFIESALLKASTFTSEKITGMG